MENNFQIGDLIIFDAGQTFQLQSSLKAINFVWDWLAPCILFLSIKMYKEMKDHPSSSVVMIFNPFAEQLIRKYVFYFLIPDLCQTSPASRGQREE